MPNCLLSDYSVSVLTSQITLGPSWVPWAGWEQVSFGSAHFCTVVTPGLVIFVRHRSLAPQLFYEFLGKGDRGSKLTKNPTDQNGSLHPNTLGLFPVTLTALLAILLQQFEF